ncbi:phospholipase D-like domain-containing protein [Marinobacterium arenosum]|uniref:phospholipase D-like domain-containing protein n=1 Tax=Marinobacterium arenosum TaxID=2862496 RepID=UPI001C97E03E|nr:phospholipase D-like domain-containing protein [Marinobacterium arenosum]MBY4676989.1 cardiolipin synthase B [Marinobacterium arenosum]
MRTRYPWRQGNRIELLVDGERFFPDMLQALQSARHSVLLEFYLLASGDIAGRFIDAMQEAASRGVMVKFLIDGFGGLKLSNGDRSRLQRAGVELVVYNPLHWNKLTRNFARDHRKLMVVDQQIAYIGGTGLSDVYWRAEQRGCPWHEVMARVEGPVVQDLIGMYNDLWQRCTARQLPPGADSQPVGNSLMRVTTVQGMYQQQIKVSFLSRVNHSRQRVWMMTAYFLPSFSMRFALRRAARRGVDVRLIIAGPYTDQPWVFHASKRYYRRLLKAGVRIFEYQPRFLHAKMAVVDEWATLGSCNLDHWNLRWNLEANIEVKQSEFVNQAAQLLRQDMQQCQEVTYEAWARRPWHRKVRELLWSWISQLVLKIR